MEINAHTAAHLDTTDLSDIVAMTRLVLEASPQLPRRTAAAAALAHLTAKAAA